MASDGPQRLENVWHGLPLPSVTVTDGMKGMGGDHSRRKIDRGFEMLVLSRKKDEKIVIGDSITLMVIEIRGDKVRLGIDAPRDVTVHREEIYDAIKREVDGADT